MSTKNSSSDKAKAHSVGENAERGVILVAPDGQEVVTANPASFNNLVYGAGYVPKEGSVAEAAQKVLEQYQP